MNIGLQLVVEHQDDRRSDTSPEVGQIALEESSHSFLRQDLGAAVDGALVCALVGCLAALHHQSPPDGVQGVGERLGRGGDGLREEEAMEHR